MRFLFDIRVTRFIPIRALILLLFGIMSVSAKAAVSQGWEQHEPERPRSERDTARFVTGDSTKAESLNVARLAIVGGVSVAGFVVGHIALNNLWWKGERSDFHFNWDDDWTYALGADKVGHAVTPYIGTDLYRQAFIWTGMNDLQSVWIGGALVSLYTTYVEVRDGFSAEWGFSWGDFAANTLGISWRVAEVYEPWLNNIRWKISYWPSEAYRSGGYSSIVDDYESTYHWASLNVNAILPKHWRPWWPDFVNIAVGHSVRGVAALDGSGDHELYLGLDWNTEGLPGDGALLRWLKRTINYYHLPAPTVRITPNVVWYGLHF